MKNNLWKTDKPQNYDFKGYVGKMDRIFRLSGIVVICVAVFAGVFLILTVQAGTVTNNSTTGTSQVTNSSDLPLHNESLITDVNLSDQLEAVISNDTLYYQNVNLKDDAFFQTLRSNTTNERKKLSTDLLQLIDHRYLPQGLSTGEIKECMQESNQYAPENDLDGEQVYVYIDLVHNVTESVLDSGMIGVTGIDEKNHIIVGWVELDNLEDLASFPEVQGIRTVIPPIFGTGSRCTNGDADHRSIEVRAWYNLTGEGKKVGIISDCVDHLQSAVDTGDLPSDVQVLRNARGGKDEGTAMLEIVHDIAPGSALCFHDSGNDHLDFMRAIDALVDAGCDVICDDLVWGDECFFEDGDIARHIDDICENNDIVYVSAAGNHAGEHYQGLYFDNGEFYHDFGEGTGDNKSLNVVLSEGEEATIVLQWNDRWGTSGNDYDLYLEEEGSGKVLQYSNDVQNGAGNPFESLRYMNTNNEVLNAHIQVKNKNGLAEQRVLEVFVFLEPGEYAYVEDINIRPEDSIFGHQAASSVVAVGAVSAMRFSCDYLEYFSAQGPSTVYYPEEKSRDKPDICGVDRVQVSGAGSFDLIFNGTSAAAPHIAGIAALIWSSYPEKDADEIKRLLLTSALDRGDPGPDAKFGYGLADAKQMYIHGNPLLKPATGTEIPVCTAEGKQDQPAVWGDRIAYRIAYSDFCIYDIPSGETWIPLKMRAGAIVSFDLSGDYFVYRPWDGINTLSIYAVSFSSGEEIPISTTYEGTDPNLSIWGNMVVWEDGTWYTDIYAFDLETSEEFAVCTDEGRQINPSIWDHTVVWFDEEDNNYHVCDLTTGEKKALPTKSGMFASDTAIEKDRVVVVDYIYGDGAMVLHNLTTGETYPICTAPSGRRSPSISGDWIVWWDGRYSPSPGDIYLFNIRTGVETRITNQSTAVLPMLYRELDLWGNHIVWADSRNADDINWYDSDIYLFEIDEAEAYSHAAFTANITSGPAPLTVQFTDISTGAPIEWAWEFGDGATSTEQHPVHTYTTAGAYTVNLTVTNGYDSDETSITDYITVRNGTISIIASGDGNPAPGDVITLSGNNTNSANTYLFLTGPNLPASGVNLVNLSVPVVSGNTSTFTIAAVEIDETWEYIWDTTSVLGRTLEEGTYTVYAVSQPKEFSDLEGVPYAQVAIRFASPIQPGNISFVADQTSGVAPLTVQFTDTSANSPTAWLWTFGDGNTSIEQHPTHTYAAPGNYTVALAVNGGTETCTRPTYIKVTPLLYGDANDDGAVNQADTLRVLREVVDLVLEPATDTDEFRKTDVHTNGVIEVGDALFIAQYNVGLRDVWFALNE